MYSKVQLSRVQNNTLDISKGQYSIYRLYGYYNTVSVLGRDEGYTVKYNPLPEGVPEAKPEGTPEGKGLYLIVYPELSPNTDIISF